MKAEVMGMSQFHANLKVPMVEMKDWEPSRIKEFMGGLANIVAAVNPNNWPERAESEPQNEAETDAAECPMGFTQMLS